MCSYFGKHIGPIFLFGLVCFLFFGHVFFLSFLGWIANQYVNLMVSFCNKLMYFAWVGILKYIPHVMKVFIIKRWIIYNYRILISNYVQY